MPLAESPANKQIPGYHAGPLNNNGKHNVIVEPSNRRIRIKFNGELVADTNNARLLHEDGHLPIYHTPFEDVRQEFFKKTDLSTHCPHKGDASYWTITVRNKKAKNAAWSYENPISRQSGLKGLIAFYWNAMDNWYEEDEEIFSHPRDPYVRVDVIRSFRTVTVALENTIIAKTKKPLLVFQTGCPTRYYFPNCDITHQLTLSGLQAHCPYKGRACFLSLQFDKKWVENIAWQYPNPQSEAIDLKNHICFDDKLVDSIIISNKEF